MGHPLSCDLRDRALAAVDAFMAVVCCESTVKVNTYRDGATHVDRSIDRPPLAAPCRRIELRGAHVQAGSDSLPVLLESS